MRHISAYPALACDIYMAIMSTWAEGTDKYPDGRLNLGAHLHLFQVDIDGDEFILCQGIWKPTRIFSLGAHGVGWLAT